MYGHVYSVGSRLQ